MNNAYISKDGKYVLICNPDEYFELESPDLCTKYYINETSDVLANKLTNLFFDDDEDAYIAEHDKFNNATDLFEDLNKIAAKHHYWITPIWKYEHSMVRYGIGTSESWDSGTVGFAFTDTESAKKEGYNTRNEWLQSVKCYLNDLTAAENGEVYVISLHNPKTDEVLDSCSGFFFDDKLSDKENIIELGTSTLYDPDEPKNGFNDAEKYAEKYQKPDYWQEAKTVTHVSYVPAE